MTALDRVVDALRDSGQEPVEKGNAWRARCPAHHGESQDSLSVKGIQGSVLLHCHAECETTDVLDALNLRKADLFDEPRGATYAYGDGRVVHRSPEKKFRQSGNTSGRPELFRLDAVRTAVLAGHPVYVVEGEKDVLALESVGVTATCAPMGAGKWSKVDDRPLHGGTVVVVADKDTPGRKHAAEVAASLAGHADVVVVEALVGKDAADHVAAGHDVSELVPVEVPQLVDEPSRRARITWASEIEPEPVEWAWEDDGAGRIPAGSLSVSAGREGTGKSSFGVWLTARITTGTLPGSFYGTPRTVFYVAVEDSWKHTLVPRLIAAGADLSKVGRFEVVTEADEELTLSLPHDNTILEREIVQHGAALVVIDPLMSVIGEKIDTHREREVRSALDPLAKMADRTRAVLMGIAHFNKGNGTDAASLITGSGAFKNVPRSVFGFARDDTDDSGTRVMSQVKNSLGRDDLPSLSYSMVSTEVPTKRGVATTGLFTFTGTSDRSVADVLRDGRGEVDHEDRREVEVWLHDLLASSGGSSPAGDVYKAARTGGYSVDQVKRAKKKIGATSTKANMDAGWAWNLPEGSTKGAKGAGFSNPPPSLPSPLPSVDEREPHLPEEPTEETEEPRNQKVSPSVPLAGSSVEPAVRGAPTCLVCARPVTVGQGDRHLSCADTEAGAA